MKSKEIIINTAFGLFLDKGYNNTSMSDLVKATNFSKGAFYHHFENKEKIYNTVIDKYFISYYKQFDWTEISKLSISEIETLIKDFYTAFVPEIMATTSRGMSRYFVLFFETFNIYPLYTETVKSFYSKLKDVLEMKYEEINSDTPEIEAIRMITKYEGLIFWFAVNPEADINNLLRDI